MIVHSEQPQIISFPLSSVSNKQHIYQMFIQHKSKYISFCMIVPYRHFFLSRNAHVPPNPYVTYSTADSHHLCRTPILTATCKPIWNFQQSAKLPIEHLFNDKKTFILKVWHKMNADIETIPGNARSKFIQLIIFYY
jgi:hypothetical protein